MRKEGLDLTMNSEAGKIETYTMFGGKVLILTPHQIIACVESNAAEQWVEAIKNRPYDAGTYGEVLVIDISSLTEVETKEQGRMVGVTYQLGTELTYEALIMKDVDTKDAFWARLKSYLPQDDYTATTENYSPFKAILFPLAVLGILLAAGAFTYWFAHILETQGGPQRRMRVKVWVAAYYYVVSWIGTKGVLILSVLGALACIAWMAKRMVNPPVKMMMTKKN